MTSAATIRPPTTSGTGLEPPEPGSWAETSSWGTAVGFVEAAGLAVGVVVVEEVEPETDGTAPACPAEPVPPFFGWARGVDPPEVPGATPDGEVAAVPAEGLPPSPLPAGLPEPPPPVVVPWDPQMAP